MKHSILLILMCVLCGPLSAQTDMRDIVPVRNDSVTLNPDTLTSRFTLPPLTETASRANTKLRAPSFPTSALLQAGLYYPNFIQTPDDTTPSLFGRYFSVDGFLQQNSYPGLMNVASASLGLRYARGRVSAYVGGIVNQYGFYRGLHTQKGVNADFSYAISPHFSATAFATYYWGNVPRMADGAPMSPAMLGFYNVSHFGGYVDYHNEHFGIQTGAQVVERVGEKSRYEVEPIATPYVRIGRGKKKIGIGLPVGQILHGILRR